MANAGALDQRITLQANTTTSDGMGGQIKGWANFADTPTVWAAVRAVRGSEVVAEGRTVAEGAWLFTIRYRGDVSEVNRIIWEGETYNITNVKRNGSRELFLVIEAMRGVAT